jgi:hypothetical protein
MTPGRAAAAIATGATGLELLEAMAWLAHRFGELGYVATGRRVCATCHDRATTSEWAILPALHLGGQLERHALASACPQCMRHDGVPLATRPETVAVPCLFRAAGICLSLGISVDDLTTLVSVEGEPTLRWLTWLRIHAIGDRAARAAVDTEIRDVAADLLERWRGETERRFAIEARALLDRTESTAEVGRWRDGWRFSRLHDPPDGRLVEFDAGTGPRPHWLMPSEHAGLVGIDLGQRTRGVIEQVLGASHPENSRRMLDQVLPMAAGWVLEADSEYLTGYVGKLDLVTIARMPRRGCSGIHWHRDPT